MGDKTDVWQGDAGADGAENAGDAPGPSTAMASRGGSSRPAATCCR